jgi:hypothetical protein
MLQVLLTKCIREARRRGLIPLWTVCDQAVQNKKAIRLLGATLKNPVILIDGIGVVTSWDMPHCLKCFRTNIFTHDLHIGKIIVSCKFVRELYEKDKIYRPNHECQHLTDENMDIDEKIGNKMKVIFACQAISQRTAANVMDAIVDISKKVRLPKEAEHTSYVISDVDKFFDAFNADSTVAPENKPWKVAVSDTSPHFKQLEEFKKSIEQWRFVKTKEIKKTLNF